MDIQQIKAMRQEVARQILFLLKKLEEETGMYVGFVNTDSETDFEGRNRGLESVSIDLTLE